LKACEGKEGKGHMRAEEEKEDGGGLNDQIPISNVKSITNDQSEKI